MAKFCPILKQKVVYLTCLECEEKLCKQADSNASLKSNAYKNNSNCEDKIRESDDNVT